MTQSAGKYTNHQKIISSDEMGETGANYTEWSKPERKTPFFILKQSQTNRWFASIASTDYFFPKLLESKLLTWCPNGWVYHTDKNILLDSHSLITETSKLTWIYCAQSCLTLWDPLDCSLPGFSVHGISQEDTGVGCHFLLKGIYCYHLI